MGGVAVGIACQPSTCIEAGALTVPGGTCGAILTGPHRSYSDDHLVAKASSFATIALTPTGSFMAIGPANGSPLHPAGEITTG